jgi:hypothetical protein
MTKEIFMAKNHALKEIDSIIASFEKPPNFFSKFKIFILDKFGVWDLWDIFPYRWNMWYYDKLEPIFKPKNSRLRKAIPRQWRDVSSLIVDVNFEFIKAFYEDEYVDGVVDWTATEHHQEFSKWLEQSYSYITNERLFLQNELDKSYPKMTSIQDMFESIVDENGRKMYKMKDDGIPYDVKYADVNRLEKLIEEKDTEILIQLIKRREYFWT